MFSSVSINFKSSAILFLATGLLICGTAHAWIPAAVDTPIAYVVLGEEGEAVARALTRDSKCPVMRIDEREVAMEVRALPESLPLRPTISATADSKPSVFPLLTCEKNIPGYAKTAMIGKQLLPLPPKQIKRIVVIGDTGCRLKKSDKAFQACNDSKLYPYAQVATAAANWKPDVVVHVGDIIYRENACPLDNPGCSESPWGYGWDAWQADFFEPGAVLLKAAPWVMVRGNHESCVRAGQGWWRMVDPRPLLPGRNCNDAVNDDSGDYSDPYTVPLGDQAQLIILDTSNTINGVIQPGDIRRAKFLDMYDKLDKLSQHADYNIVASHHPILGFAAARDKEGKIKLLPGNQGIQSVFSSINPLIMPPRINYMLAGHVHLWQEVSFSTPHPTQFIAGFSGTMEDTVPLPDSLPSDATPALGAVVEHFSSWINGFGFMTLERIGQKQWDVKVWDSGGRVVNSCKVEGRHSLCVLSQPNGHG